MIRNVLSNVISNVLRGALFSEDAEALTKVYFPLEKDLFDSTGLYEVEYTGTSAVMVLDHDGKYVESPAELPPFRGGRMVENLIHRKGYNSEDCAGWQNVSFTGTPIKTYNSIASDANTFATYVGILLDSGAGLPDSQGMTVTISCEMRVDAAQLLTNKGGLRLQLGVSPYTIIGDFPQQLLSTEWVKYSVTGTVPSGAAISTLRAMVVSQNNGDSTPVYFQKLLVENVTGQSNTNPAEYVPVGPADGKELWANPPDGDWIFAGQLVWTALNGVATINYPDPNLGWSAAEVPFDWVEGDSYFVEVLVTNHVSGNTTVQAGNGGPMINNVIGSSGNGLYSGTFTATSANNIRFQNGGTPIHMDVEVVSVQSLTTGYKWFNTKNPNVVVNNVVNSDLSRTVENIVIGSNHPKGQSFTPIAGNEYVLTMEGEAGSTVRTSGGLSFSTLTNDGINRVTTGLPTTANSTNSTTIVITGNIHNLMIEDVTGKVDQNPSEYVPNGAPDGIELWTHPANGDWTLEAGWTENAGILSATNCAYKKCYTTFNWEDGVEYYVRVRMFNHVNGGVYIRTGSLGAYIVGSGYLNEDTIVENVFIPDAKNEVRIQASSNDTYDIEILSVQKTLPGIATFTTENGNTFVGNIVTESVGSDILPASLDDHPWLLTQRAGTNAVAAANYRDFSTWTAFGTHQLDQTEVGIDGQPNTAWRMQDDDSSWIATFDAPNIVVIAGRKHGATVFVKADTNTYRRVGIYLKSTSTEFMILGLATDDGSMHEHTITNGKYRVDREGDWWKVTLNYDDIGVAYTDLHMKIAPALFNYAGVVTSTLTGAEASCIVDWVQVEKDQTFPERVNSGLIKGGETRNESYWEGEKDDLITNDAGGFTGEFKLFGVDGTHGSKSYPLSTDEGTFYGHGLQIASTVEILSNSGSPITYSRSLGIDGVNDFILPFKTGLRWNGSETQVGYNGVVNTPVAYTGDKGFAASTKLHMGRVGPWGAGYTGLWHGVTFYKYDMGEEQLQADVTL